VSELAVTSTGAAFGEQHYEPWLFQVILDELTTKELGIDFIYKLLEMVAKRYELTDVVVVLQHDALTIQEFRLGGAMMSGEAARSMSRQPGLYCEPDVVPQVEKDALRTACQLALSLQMARFVASRDPLTSIANRLTFDKALDNSAIRAARYGWPFTLIVVDLRGLKMLNDRFGHDFGDRMLRTFGFALRVAVRQGDLVARIGGDEFAVILNNAEGSEASSFIERLQNHLAQVGETIEFTFGTASAPLDSTDPVELTRLADARLYAKRGIIHR
jgi:diguanylate cyclase (GGDEF)-like protein